MKTLVKSTARGHHKFASLGEVQKTWVLNTAVIPPPGLVPQSTTTLENPTAFTFVPHPFPTPETTTSTPSMLQSFIVPMNPGPFSVGAAIPSPQLAMSPGTFQPPSVLPSYVGSTVSSVQPSSSISAHIERSRK